MCLNSETFVVFLSLQMVTKRNKLESLYVKSISPMEKGEILVVFFRNKREHSCCSLLGSS